MRIFVGNIPHSTNETELKSFFEEGGEQVSFAQIIRDRETGHSRGFGFVELRTQLSLSEIITKWNGLRFGNRVLTINTATPRTPREQNDRERV